VLQGFEETDILPFGGRLEVVRPESSGHLPITLIPPFPIYPPETSWMRHPGSQLPGLVLHENRVAYVPADIDRCLGRDNFPDHADLLANLIRWAANDRIPLRVEGTGLIDCHLYRQPGRLILHLVNLSGAGTWRAPMHEFIAVGPLRVRVQLPEDVTGSSARLLVAEQDIPASRENGWVTVDSLSITDHEVVVIS
jgi:hypothetical protein